MNQKTDEVLEQSFSIRTIRLFNGLFNMRTADGSISIAIGEPVERDRTEEQKNRGTDERTNG